MINWKRRSARESAQLGSGGHIARHGLTDWFRTTFSTEEIEMMEERWKPFGASSGATLTTGAHIGTDSPDPNDTYRFLYGLAGWFRTAKESHIAMRLFEKAREYEGDVISRHLYFTNYIPTRYKQRKDDPRAIADVVAACEEMISIAPRVREEMKRQHGAQETRAIELGAAAQREEFAGVPPRHVGYERLIILRRKAKQFEEVERLEKDYKIEWKDHSIDARRS